MCRHLAYLGPPVTLEDLLLTPPSSLLRQSWAPRRQRHGAVNADGFGAGWYVAGRAEPVRYRRAQPMWTDASFASLAPTIASGCILAAVRSATPGFGPDESCSAPVTVGRWLFSHNGRLADWPAARKALADRTYDVAEAAAPVDSALLFGLAAARWTAGTTLAAGLRATVQDARSAGGGRLTLLATDGSRIAGTCAGEPLFVLTRDDAVVVASEPYDDDGAWTEVPDDSLVEADLTGLTITPLDPIRGPLMRSTTLDVHLSTDDLRATLVDDARRGLTAMPKSLPAKYFYDARGSELFEQITRLPEYYLTRAEESILNRYAADVVAAAGRPDTLVELGSGSSTKTRLLLDALAATGRLHRYVPVDVSPSALEGALGVLAAAYPAVELHGVVADFEAHLDRLPAADGRLVAFLGSTVGNLEPGERYAFLTALRAELAPDDAFLLGVDLVKDERRLVAAYDDPAGVTAEFNRNVLQVLNASLGANFRPEAFDHVARWNAAAEWMEMSLRARSEMAVDLTDLELRIGFAAGEEIRTEISAKFRRAGLAAELAAAGFDVSGWWTDPAGDFALALAAPR